MRARPGLVLATVAGITYLFFAAQQLTRPLMYDDANFALAARAVAQTGLPFGNQGWMNERGDFSQREQYALWHPPLYVYATGLLAWLFGGTPAVLRILGVCGGLASGLITFQLARELTRAPSAGRDMAGGVAAALVLLCPLTVQSALVVDIDLALLLPLTLLFVLLYLRLESTPRRWLALAPLYALLLWTKMTNPLPLLLVLAVWQVLRGNIKRAAVQLLGLGGLGGALFVGSWLLVAGGLRLPFGMPFAVNALQWQDSAEVARRAYISPNAFVQGLQPMVLWLGPGLVALGLLGIAVRVAQLVGCWHFRRADVFVALVLVLTVGYVNKYAAWFPKYQVTLAPMLALAAAPIVGWAYCARPRLWLAATLAVAAFAGLIVVSIVRDHWALQRTWAIDGMAAALLLGLIIVGALVRPPASGVLAALVGLGLGWSVATDVTQLAAPYQTTYWYGTTGSLEAANWITAHVAPDQTYVAAKEVAVAARPERYVDQDNLVYFIGVGRAFDGTWAGETIHTILAWEREAYVADLFSRTLPSAGYREIARFGDYVVYER